MYRLEELERVYKEYEKEYINSEYIPEEKQRDYNYLILGCIKYNMISPKEHLQVLENIGAKSPMSIFCDEYLELKEEIERNEVLK